ncbi:anti-sigma factor [Aequorivita sp. F47161]|uniref:Anti-sigma factor n=1 Tax=Aequorivita vitellina TaxID=2874475 RepID=A0A9X1QS24_9FLAO|nr:anti-sigma factor [Aequorivita vitellina]MCG2418316.1 anti-sigma factor [Aequorivita vitellina]MCZ4319393.1 anti-sigma factor [Aequorivita viscosa]
MNPEEIIASGKLEMYVCGALPEDEALEIEKAVNQFPEVKRELELIEKSLLHLAEAVAPPVQAMTWSYILERIRKTGNTGSTKVRAINWPAITGWAAAILFMGGIMWMLKQTNDLNKSLKVTTIENNTLREEKSKAENQLAENAEVLEVLRSKDYQAYTLPGNQAVAPDAFAKVFLNKKENVAYIDVKGLPTPPRGKVYQVWSLKMEPLTPTSVGLIDADNKIGEGIYKFVNFPDPEAFGITLEPEGGSETPTLSQLYTLGMITI